MTDHLVPGRPYSRDTRLGRILAMKGHTDYYHFCSDVDISPRQMSRYINGEAISASDLGKMALELEVPGELLQEESNGGASEEEIVKLLKGE